MHKKSKCPCCGQSVGERNVTLYSGMVSLLWRIFEHCLITGTDTITRKEIRPFIKNENDTARLGDWKYFGNLVSKEEKGIYRLDMQKCWGFFNGRVTIPVSVWKTIGSEDYTVDDYRSIKEIPSLVSFFGAYGNYITKYRKPTR